MSVTQREQGSPPEMETPLSEPQADVQGEGRRPEGVANLPEAVGNGHVFPAPVDISPRTKKKVHSLLERHRVVARRVRSREADIFRMLRTKVMRVMEREGMRAIAVTSANYGDGKTTIVCNLALSMALDLKRTVLLVDLDLRNPRIHQFMGIQSAGGLTDYLLHDRPINECLVRPQIERLAVLPTMSPVDHSSEMLASPKMAQLAEELRCRYPDRLVIYDMPPLLSQDDAIAFLPNVDGVLLVVRDGVTSSADVSHCLHQLLGTPVIGTVLNDSADAV